MEPTDDTRNARLSKLIDQSRAELDQLEAQIASCSSSCFPSSSFSSLKQLLRELEKEEEEEEIEIEIEDEGKEKSSFKPPKGAVRIPGMEAGGALGKEFLQNLKLKNKGGNGEEEEEEAAKPTAFAKPTWMIELAAKKAAARAREEEGA
tara:strand:- start:276 stop:722 length:447 start_codon:yes stop_codon:yes gene_type:complete